MRIRALAAMTTALAGLVLSTFAATPVAATPLPVHDPPRVPDPPPGRTSFAVSAPADPVRAEPGTTADTWLMLTNNGLAPVDVKIRIIRLVPHDNGQLEIVDEPDPQWITRAEVPAGVTIPATAQIKARIRLEVAANLLPDLYMVGLLVEPVNPQPAGQELMIRSQITTVVMIEVPGPRERMLKVELAALPRVRIGHDLTGSFAIRNVGSAAAMTRGQVRIDSATNGTNRAVIAATGARMQFVPAGTSRAVSYRWHSDDLVALARPTVQLAYGNGGASLGEVTAAGRPVLMLAPGFVAAVAGVAVLLAAGLVLRLTRLRTRRLRARRGRAGHRQPRVASRDR